MDTLAEMEKIVKAKVKTYQEDFYDYDTKALEEMGEGEEAIWEVRDTGTFFFPGSLADHEECEFYRSVQNAFGNKETHHWYLVLKGKSIEPISDRTALWFIDSFERAFVKRAKKAYQEALMEWKKHRKNFPTLEDFKLTAED